MNLRSFLTEVFQEPHVRTKSPLPSDTKLLRKELPENYFSELLRDFAPRNLREIETFSRKFDSAKT